MTAEGSRTSTKAWYALRDASIDEKCFRPSNAPRIMVMLQNLVSINDPDVIESLRASCNGIGTDVTKSVYTSWVVRGPG